MERVQERDNYLLFFVFLRCRNELRINVKKEEDWKVLIYFFVEYILKRFLKISKEDILDYLNGILGEVRGN